MILQLFDLSRQSIIEQESTTELTPDPSISANRFLQASIPIFAPTKDGSKLKFNPKIQRKIFGSLLGKLKITEKESEAKLGLVIIEEMPELLAE